ncbi:keratin-associated protein 10-2 [Euwallacea fornicatus]|uniref:keratin-associated protein 10-2 n=1 Tax=Euwallacea fornicatus TaxID=995702 RepID=UPI0033902B5A
MPGCGSKSHVPHEDHHSRKRCGLTSVRKGKSCKPVCYRSAQDCCVCRRQPSTKKRVSSCYARRDESTSSESSFTDSDSSNSSYCSSSCCLNSTCGSCLSNCTGHSNSPCGSSCSSSCDSSSSSTESQESEERYCYCCNGTGGSSDEADK